MISCLPARPIFAVCACAALVGCGFLQTRRPEIRLVSDPAGESRAVFEFTGVPAGLVARVASGVGVEPSLFTVRVVVPDAGSELDVPTLSGSWSVDGETVSFRPRFPLARGLRVRAEFRPPEGSGAVEEFVWVDPARDAVVRVPRVTAFYPSADVIPANLLKIYLHFSRPMSVGQAYRRIRLLGPGEKLVKHPFLELDEELWNRDGTRLTVFFDPGRIKRELLPNEEVGPSLEAGKRYAIEIDAGWPSADGVPIGETFRREFDVGPPDRRSPDPGSWDRIVPAAGSLSSLTVVFPEPLDHALVERLLRVHDAAGQELTGESSVGLKERSWSFKPTLPWRAGAYQLRMESFLEDLAGNSIGRSFEVDVFQVVKTRVDVRTIGVDFSVPPSP